jgi:beta-glucosidase
VLKKDWGYPGYVMSDWGATHSTIPGRQLRGLDQQSGWPFDKSPTSTRAEGSGGQRPRAGIALDDMVHRILRTMFMPTA